MFKYTLGKLAPALLLALAFFVFPLQTTVKAQDGTTPTTLFLPNVLTSGAKASPTGSGDFSIAAVDAARNELNGGSTPFAFTVTRAGLLNQVTTVKCVVTGSGTNGATNEDFEGGVLLQGLLQFGVGEASKTLIIYVHGDTAPEPDEGFTVTLANASGDAHIVGSTATGTIRNYDDAGQIGSGDFGVAAEVAVKDELNSGPTFFNFTVARSGDASRFTMVDYTVVGGGAAAAAADDFDGSALPQGQLQFAPGEASKLLIVRVQGDNAVEPDEGFTVTLSHVSGSAQIVTPATSTTIRNDDVTRSTDLALTASDTEQPEGADSATSFVFNVTRAGIVDGLTTVDYSVDGSGPTPAAADDFVGGVFPSGTLTFTTGETERTLTVAVQGDLGIEDDESFAVILAGPSGGAHIIANSAAGAIKNDDSTDLAISLADPDKPEGDSGCTEYSFVLTRSGDTSGETAVDYTLGPIEAFPVDAHDYCAASYGGEIPSGTYYFAAGESERLLYVYMQGDTEIEENEDFVLTLSNPTGGARILGAEVIADIRNDDSAVLVTLSIDQPIVAASENLKEGAGGVITPFSFIVTRSGNPLPDATVSYFASGDGDNPANGADFENGQYPLSFIHFDAGAPFAQLTINVRGDADQEPNEGFAVTLESPSDGALIVKGGATGVIQNDDGWSPEEAAAIRATAAGAGIVLPSPKKDTVTALPPKSDAYWSYTYQEHDVVGNNESIANFGKGADILYAGNLFEGNGINNYAYAPISLPRMPISISLSLETAQSVNPNTNAPPVKISGTILPVGGQLGVAQERDAIKGILDGAIGISPAARVSWDSEQIFSQSQLTAFAKANVESGDFGFEGKFDFSENSAQTKIVAKYEQVYFTVDMNTPLRASDLFDARLTNLGEIQAALTGKSPMYLASVSYGLVAYVFVESNEKASKVEAAMKATYDGIAKGEVEAGVTADSVLKNAKIRVVIYGGSTKGLAANYDTYDDFKKVVDASTVYGPEASGLPVAYNFRRLLDNTAAMTTYASKYVEVVPLAKLEQLRIQVKALHMDSVDDEGCCAANKVEIQAATVYVNGYARSSLFAPLGPPVVGSDYALFRDGGFEWLMNNGDEQLINANPIYLQIPAAPPNTWEATLLQMNGYALDYDSEWGNSSEYGWTPGGPINLLQTEWWPPANKDPNAFPKYIGFFNTDHKVPVYSSDFSGYYIVNVQRVTPPPKPPQVDAAS